MHSVLTKLERVKEKKTNMGPTRTVSPPFFVIERCSTNLEITFCQSIIDLMEKAIELDFIFFMGLKGCVRYLHTRDFELLISIVIG